MFVLLLFLFESRTLISISTPRDLAILSAIHINMYQLKFNEHKISSAET